MTGRWSQYLQFWLRNTQKSPRGKSKFLGLCDSLLMGLRQDQQQHPAVHSVIVSRGRVRGCDCWR